MRMIDKDTLSKKATVGNITEWIGRCGIVVVMSVGLCLPTGSQNAAPNEVRAQKPQESTVPTPPSCPCAQRKQKPAHNPTKLPCPTSSSCDLEKQKAACTLEMARAQASRNADLGQYYLSKGQHQAAFAACHDALKLASDLQSARDCVNVTRTILQKERKKELAVRLAGVDAYLWRAEANEAFAEIARIRSDLSPATSPLGDFDEGMNAEIAKRFCWAKWIKWGTWFLTSLPILFWTVLKVLTVILVAVIVVRLLRFALTLYSRHQKYKTRKLESEGVDWMVWSIGDSQNQGAAGPVMDALNPKNNPLLNRRLTPSSLLLVPFNAGVVPPFVDDNDDNEESSVWRDFLDPPRQAIDIEVLPLEDFEKHHFIQIEAFDELDVKVGGVEAKGLMSLFRTIRRVLDRGLPAAQGTVYTLAAHDNESGSHACVRITCNWTTEVKALSSIRLAQEEDASLDKNDSHEGTTPGDETISVFASSENDPSIDAVALSAQRAAFKLFHRLATKSSPTYATAVANFHQGVELIDEYI